MTSGGRYKIALLSYRGDPHVGGQGVYAHYLSRALAEQGHDVTVFSGQPYPDLADGVSFVPVPSLDLYRPDDPFRRPRLREFRDAIDVLEYSSMCTAAFPEPLTFSLRAARLLSGSDFDIVHDNQCLGYGLLRIQRSGTPVLATIHHPIPIDRDLAIAQARDFKRRIQFRRWYSFVRMQRRVARRLPRVLTVSDSSAADINRELGISHDRIGVVHNGVDTDFFLPLEGVRRRSEQIIAMASSDLPMKGIGVLVEAVAKLATERDVHLVLVGNGGVGDVARAAIARFGAERSVTLAGRVDGLSLVRLYAESSVAVVPSLYEGFSLPAIEAMSCALPLVTTTGGALPEIAGRDGEAALLVPAGDASALAGGIRRLLDDPELRARMGAAGRERVGSMFSWRSAAAATLEQYARVL